MRASATRPGAVGSGGEAGAESYAAGEMSAMAAAPPGGGDAANKGSGVDIHGAVERCVCVCPRAALLVRRERVCFLLEQVLLHFSAAQL